MTRDLREMGQEFDHSKKSFKIFQFLLAICK